MNFRGRLQQTGYRLILGVLVSVFALQAQSACNFFDGFTDNLDGTVTDPRSGLIWKQCAEGFKVNGWNGCKGSSDTLTWIESMKLAKDSNFLGKKDWRLPTKSEFEQVAGSFEDCRGNAYEKGEYAASKLIAHPILNNGSAGYFWSTTPGSNRDTAWVVGLDIGYSLVHHRNLVSRNLYGGRNEDAISARLVRDPKAAKSKSKSEFEREYSSFALPLLLVKQRKEADEATQERRAQAARDEQYRRDAPARQASQMCEAQKQSCLATCGNPTYWNGRSYVDNQSWSMCYSRCNQINCY